MIEKSKILSLLLALLLVVSLFSSCGKKEEPTTPAIEEIPVAESEPVAPEEEATTANTITDMAGRVVELPEEINTVYASGPVAAIYLYTLDPEKLLGWNYDLNDSEKAYILPAYQELTAYGMGSDINIEAVIAAAPNVALQVSKLDDSAKAEADKLSLNLGIPVIVLSEELEDSAEAYTLLGTLLGNPTRGQELADYAAKTLSEMVITVPEEEQVRVYYGNGKDSLETAPAGSWHGQVIEMVGGKNVAEIEVEGVSRIQVSLEQVLSWDPDYIVVNGEPKENLSPQDAVNGLLNNPDFAEVQAVKDGKVVGIPRLPFSWVDRPAGPNRLLGLRWLGTAFYPEKHDLDITQEVKDFYQLFYHTDLTEAQLGELITS